MLPELTILAYCEEMIPIVAEIALDCGYAPKFRIIENMKTPKGAYAIEVPGAEYELITKAGWTARAGENVAFSVVQPPSKHRVFLEFQGSCGLERANYPDLIHPSSFVSKTAKTGGGLLLEPLSAISAHTALGFGITIRRGVTIGHHGTIGDFTSIFPGVTIGGMARIGERVTIGIGAVVLDKVEIGAGAFIGAGSLVTRNIPAGVLAYGSPCKVIREIENQS